ncbi:hypothetical protein Pyn_07936 [Prunus yedoensis var. nudiflora]|uniref:Uncharacterized protein n=1 Tax=Prunus yedoensis var. nudiflora TaxID=2094558 RepID=A0A314Z4Q1_PRUYE|nr:hypothetical protein Pyn_07936 [Prunus yedoensis var. nudiflora]
MRIIKNPEMEKKDPKYGQLRKKYVPTTQRRQGGKYYNAGATPPSPPSQTTIHTSPRGGTFITPASATTRMRAPIHSPACAQSQNAYASSRLRQTGNSVPWKPLGKVAARKHDMLIPKKQKT